MRIRMCGSGVLYGSDEARGGGLHPSSCEILQITAGRALFRWRDNLCEAHAPAVFILPASIPHELRCRSGEAKFRFWELVDEAPFPFTDRQVDEWNFRQPVKSLFTQTLAGAAILQTLDFLFYLHAGEADRLDVHLEEVSLLEIRKVYRLIAHLLVPAAAGEGAAAGARRTKRKPREAVDLLIDYMDWKYKEPITLGGLAELVHLNPSYLVRLFRKQTGMTPFAYLQDLRLKAAASFLSGSALPIRDIVEETGFGSVHYFSRLFKRVYGQSPAAWRSREGNREKLGEIGPLRQG